MSVTSKNLETSRTKNPDSSGLCVSNIQSAALKWSDLRYKWQPDMQRDRIRNRRIFSAERCTAIVYNSFLPGIPPHRAPPSDRTAHPVSSNKWGYSSCFVCFFDIFFSFLYLCQSFSQKKKNPNWITTDLKKTKRNWLAHMKMQKTVKINTYIFIRYSFFSFWTSLRTFSCACCVFFCFVWEYSVKCLGKKSQLIKEG